MFEERSIVLGQWESVKARAQPLETDLTAARAELLKLVAAGRQVQQAGAAIELQVARLRQETLATWDDNLKAVYQAQIADLQIQYAACQRRYSALDLEVRKVNVFIQGIQAQLYSIGREATQLQQKGD